MAPERKGEKLFVPVQWKLTLAKAIDLAESVRIARILVPVKHSAYASPVGPVLKKKVTRHADQIRKRLRSSSSEEPDWNPDIVEDVATHAATPPEPDTQPGGRKSLLDPVVPATPPRNARAIRGHRSEETGNKSNIFHSYGDPKRRRYRQ
ncbi:hypothetical protein KGM_211548 [Danaus plexippus plexippus]|uniref:Uncharacterized protein n=1 Tax=Danaus plexippus plexippus TaxID=278856 RepID=A0A212EJQ5_DANPL|nr:hypothetical protein KGM_211548 [Danaus plexippus plexippus]